VSTNVSRVVQEIGREGKLGIQASSEDLTGAWKNLIDDVNVLGINLTAQVRSIALVSTAIAKGDLSQKITVETRGEFLELKNTINATVDQLRAFAAEVIRVAREVGTEGKLGAQADVRGVSGVWQELTDSVNQLAGNLTSQVRNIAQIATAISAGDLSQKITVEAKGEVLELKNTLNSTVDQLRSFAAEVTRVAREVGAEGRLGAQVDVRGVSGTWKDLTDSVNMLAGNLTDQVRNIAVVATAIATGDLSQKITVEAKGEILELKNTINAMVDRLQTFAAEVTRVAREVGTEGKLGGQADVKGVSGTWKDLTDNVNVMASNLTDQVRGIAKVVTAVATGDLSQKFAVEAKGEIAALADTINNMTDALRTFADQVTTVAREVGIEGKLGGQAKVPGVSGTWRDLTDNVNTLAGNLTNQVRNIALVTTAVANGDLSQKITVEAKGEILELKNTVNGMVEQLRTFASEVTRVAKEVGTEGELGGQAVVSGVAGTWKDLTDNVNVMALNLTSQVRGIAKVVTAVAEGDLSQKFVVEAKGEIAALADTINDMTETLRTFAAQVTTVAREVGIEGKLGGQANVPGVSGTWKDLTDNVNLLAGNLTNQVRNIAFVTTAVANGDLSQKITVEAQGEILEVKNTINAMVDQLRTFASEVTRIAKEVGTEGKLGAQADIKGVAGTWKDLTDNVNLLAANLTSQVRNIAAVTTAVANGDLSTKITVEAKGEILELKNTINAMVEQLRTFASEVTRVAREVGTDGRLGGQAQVPGVAGTWKDLTDNVNVMASNLTNQVRGMAKVVTAVASGDLSQKFVVEAKGEIATLADTINNMTDTLRTFADQVTTVAREVGIEGKLGGQARVPGVSGTWRDLTDNVNVLAANLTNQVRNIALVSTAIANGDLSQKITVEAQGEILELKNTINAMVEQLRTFAKEVTRVAREVGTEGKLGGQAKVPGVAGTWQELTDSVNLMAGNLTSQVRGIAKVVTAVADGDLGQKLVLEVRGEIAALADTINGMTDTLRTFAEQVTTVAREVGIEGKLGGQALVPGASGTWRALTDSVNMLAGNLTSQVRNIALVTTAVANGDLSKKISVEAKGEILELKDTINAMVEQLRTFAAEVTRVAREVGTEGQLGGQARVPGVSGTWKDLTDNVNVMASNLTDQVRGISKVVTAVANGELTGKLVLVAKGEIAALADTINDMTDTLRTFADQVTTVAREVGVEGKLGGQAKVPGAAGTWRDLVDNVNQLAGNLTTQVRAIFDVATAVTKGDLTRTIDVEAQGEVLSLKDTINQMIANLRDTTRTNMEQDWLKTNLAKFSSMMQGQRTLESLSQLIMSELTPGVSAQIGTFFVVDKPANNEKPVLKLLSTYGYTRRKSVSNRYAFGEGLVGQAALEKKPILVTQVPDDYVPIASSIGEAPARNLVVFPIQFEGSVRGVIELGSFEPFSPIHLTFLEQLSLNMGVVFNMISASRRTEELLEELKRSNAELGRRSTELEDKAEQLELKNREIAEASANLEDKAAQLALVSKYKSEFLTNMSHELRTPMNSIMILAGLLAENSEGNLTSQQVQYAETVQSSGHDLLSLINQILDLSKIEAGSMEIDKRVISVAELRAYAESTFRPVAEQRMLRFEIVVDAGVPATLATDPQRLQQILKNLLSNAFKFTDAGSVELHVSLEHKTKRFQSPSLRAARSVIAFAITDTGIGIPFEKQQLIFEAFQQADSSTNRIYGGTGLGLTISRELARLLGGEIHLRSAEGTGSTFTLFLPCTLDPEELGRLLREEGRDGEQREPRLESGAERRTGARARLEAPDPAAPDASKSPKGEKKRQKGSGEAAVRPPGIVWEALRVAPPPSEPESAPEEQRETETKPDERGPGVQASASEGAPAPQQMVQAERAIREESLRERAPSRSDSGTPSMSNERPRAAKSDPTKDAMETLSGRRILVVDDDSRNLFALASLLERYGARVLPASSAQDAFDVLEQNPDVAAVFMDMMMPEMDGYEATRRLREDPRHQGMPIIALTAKTMPGDREKALDAGCDDFVAKPVDKDQLLGVLQRWMRS
jgi:HAMP domain-containing protein/signal transduction histidine kinase/ActR/RegA family two-component response regulator